MPTILLVGADEMLLQTRAAILKKTGAEIVCANAAAAQTVEVDREFDLVVLCHSLSTEVCTSLAQTIRERWPKTRILSLETHREWRPLEVLAVVDGTSTPEPDRLIGRTIELLARRAPMEGGTIEVRGAIVRAGQFGY